MYLARFAIGLAALSLTCKAVSQNTFRPKHCKLIERLYGLTLYSALVPDEFVELLLLRRMMYSLKSWMLRRLHNLRADDELEARRQ